MIVNVEAEQLTAMANRYCSLVAQSYLPIEGHDVRVTVSVGATLANSGDTLASLMRRADELMYRSKASGKDRVSVG